MQELPVIDVLLFKGLAEYQVRTGVRKSEQRLIVVGDDEFLEVGYRGDGADGRQSTHVMQYFRDIEEPRSRLPSGFVGKFLEGKA